jgi:hypothetical protein
MKRVVLLLVLLFSVSIILAAGQPDVAPVNDEDVEKIQNVANNLPIDTDTGSVDFDKYKPFRTKAEERIAVINKYVGPITKVLFGVELSLSWIFIFSVALWILLIELIIEPVHDIFDWNFWWSLVGSVIIATLAMQGFGKNFVVWINSIVTAWYVALMVLLFMAVFWVVYSFVMRYFGAKTKAMKKVSEEEQTAHDRAIIHADAEVSEKNLKSLS